MLLSFTMQHYLSFIRNIFVLILLVFLSSCASLAYYSQSISGQFALINSQQDIEQLLQSTDTITSLKNKLVMVKKIRRFASQALALPDNASYQNYADLGRDYVVWNVFATPKLSLQPLQWCFIFVGCLNYRGYFSKQAAQQFAQSLQAQGYDVFVGGVSAYSTLGWFDDPVLNTMLKKDMTYLAKVMFHELAHQKIYVKNDTEFNEAFAETVALAGVKLWLSQNGSEDALLQFNIEQTREDEFVQLVLQTRKRLERLYDSAMSDLSKQQKKAGILADMRAEYIQLRKQWDDDPSYDAWFDNDLNNAKFAAVTTYRDLVPYFMSLLEKSGNDFDVFYQLINQLKTCSIEKRRSILTTGKTQFEC